MIRSAVVLAAVLLAAHFVHSGPPWALAAPVAVAALAFVPRPWAARAVQLLLALGTLEWAYTTYALASQRRILGQPYLRLVLILSAVAVYTAACAVLAGRLPASLRLPASTSSKTKERT